MSGNNVIKILFDRFLKSLKRVLHVLAFLEYPSWKDDGVNYRKLADIIGTLEENRVGFSDKIIRTSVDFIRDVLGFEVPIKKGERVVSARINVSPEIERRLLEIYTGFVVKDLHKPSVIWSTQKKHLHKAMWLFAVLYFSIKEKNVLKIEYKKPGYPKAKSHIIHPYHLVSHRNSYYLVAFSTTLGKTVMFKLKFINNIQHLGKKFDEEIPDLEDLFKHSLDAYIGDRLYTIKLLVYEEVYDDIADILYPLDYEILSRKDEEYSIIQFDIKDYYSLFRELFLYAGYIEILEPYEIREEFRELCKTLVDMHS